MSFDFYLHFYVVRFSIKYINGKLFIIYIFYIYILRKGITYLQNHYYFYETQLDIYLKKLHT